MNEVESLFENYSNQLEQENELREKIKQITKELDRILRHQAAILQQVHSKVSQAKEIAAKAKEQFPAIKEQFLKLQDIVRPQFSKYHDHWRFALTSLVFQASFIHWIETGQVLALKAIEELIGAPGLDSSGTSFGLEIEDYLQGLTLLPNELSRLCVNSVTAGEFEIPLKISKFVGDLYSGFRMLNLKNDNLRKRFDTIKYDVKKIEEVVYDISIRKLTPQTQNANPAMEQ
mmetsp:Transcript_22996/g.32067  ORF Transcript_22996/g.32067 Transcript_22996/m.32067 type:complete len:231 (-) Transcript_22996:24-716(-)